MCDHFHLSLQSGCDETLKRMNRKYTAETFENDIYKLEEIYDRSEIVSNLQNTKENISNMVCRKVSERYNIPSFSRFSLTAI